MTDESVVQLGVKYLNECRAAGKRATLLEMLEYIDYFDRLIPNAEEINAVLARVTSIFVDRTEGRITFSSTGHERSVTEEDVHHACLVYNEDFQRRLRELATKQFNKKASQEN